MRTIVRIMHDKECPDLNPRILGGSPSADRPAQEPRTEVIEEVGSEYRVLYHHPCPLSVVVVEF